MKANIYDIINLELSSKYQFILGRGILSELVKYINLKNNQKVMMIVDECVWDLYKDVINTSFFDIKNEVFFYIVKSGEDSKNYENVILILEMLAEKGFNKSDMILSIGGGVVGDLSGFISSIYQRGINHTMVATTVLAAVDSSVGGKTAINLKYGKNLVGSFYQPSRVICDVEVFKSLSDRIFYEGVAESIKYAMIYDADMIHLFEGNIRESHKICEIISKSVKIKYDVVKNDEKDQGIRQILNFGHTIAHALEQASNYELRHGEAVSIGMYYMCRISEKYENIENKSFQNIKTIKLLKNRKISSVLVEILKRYNLPYTFKFNFDEILKYILLDKKIRDGYISIILLSSLGKAKIEKVNVLNLREFLYLEDV